MTASKYNYNMDVNEYLHLFVIISTSTIISSERTEIGLMLTLAYTIEKHSIL